MSDYGNDPGWLAYQQRMSDENINTLVVLHRVYGGLMAAASCMAGMYGLFVGGILTFASSMPNSKPGEAPPPFVGAFVGLIMLAVVGFIVLICVLNFLCANWLRDRRNWTGVVVVAGIDCLTGVLGIALGVFTLIVLNRPAVKDSFR